MVAGSAGAPQTLDELQRVTGARPAWLVSLVQPEIGGGRLHPAQFAELEAAEGATALRVSRLDQASFERVIADHRSRFSAIHFWKCPRVADLNPLGDLPQLELMAWYWNQRATTLWDLARTPRLRGLAFEDFTTVRVLDDLRAGTSLRELVFGDVVKPTLGLRVTGPARGAPAPTSPRVHPARDHRRPSRRHRPSRRTGAAELPDQSVHEPPVRLAPDTTGVSR